MAIARFQDRVAVVTGGANGIGRAVAARLVGEGARVALVDKDQAGLERAAAELGDKVLPMCCDVSREEDVVGYIERAARELGGIHLFHHNAGVEGPIAPLTECSAEDYDRVQAINARSVFLGLREALRFLKRQGSGGAIVNTTSLAGLFGVAAIGPYVASKHAVVGLTKTAALESASFGVRVNAVAPGQVDTRMVRVLEESLSPGNPEAVRNALLARVPLRRYAKPEEVANLVCWLLSDEAAFVTGTVHTIDGGFDAGFG